ncbi:hypothetical protein GCM10023322_29190 [Rugosimonospora acidiphila]|uniref:Ricin B lectin domain-containing protein n=1 Tax=Rugosimonospora acidiphila TaxID=556531 RepID=A0ABP9RSB6_9ACTN
MAPVPDGLYQIGFPGAQLLTLPLETDQPGMPVLLLPPAGERDTQVWEIRAADGGNCTIRGKSSELYLGFDGEPDMQELVVGYSEPRQWQIDPGAEPGTYTVGVPDTKFRLGRSLLRVYPPRVALLPSMGDQFEAWFFLAAG